MFRTKSDNYAHVYICIYMYIYKPTLLVLTVTSSCGRVGFNISLPISKFPKRGVWVDAMC